MLSEPSRRRGRPIKLTPAVRAAIVELVGNGNSLADAARAAGVNPSTLFRAQGRSATFAAALEAAETGLKPKLVACVTAAAIGGDWRAALAILERRFPAEWGRRLAVAGDATNPTPIAIAPGAEMREVARKLATLSTDELRALAPVRRPTGDGLGPFPGGSPDRSQN